MGQDPSAIRQEIEQTRAQMGDTVEAIGYKTDVKSRAADKITGVRERISGAAPASRGTALTRRIARLLPPPVKRVLRPVWQRARSWSRARRVERKSEAVPTPLIESLSA